MLTIKRGATPTPAASKGLAICGPLRTPLIYLALGTLATTGWAQTTAAPGVSGNPASDAQGIPEIIVTAQRRSEDSQSVPISMAVVSGAQITDSGFKDLTDIQFLAPGISYTPTGGSGFNVRGIGTQVFDYSTEQAVGTVIDQVVYTLPRNPGLDSLNDIDHVEVLRGPQGTLFGKNATAGVVSITTKSPVLGTFGGSFETNYGQYNDLRIGGVVNLPLGDNAALRISAIHIGEDGIGFDPVIRARLGDVTESGVRAKLLIEPNSNLQNTLTLEYGYHYDTYPNGNFVTANPAVTASDASYGIVVGPNNKNVGETTLPYSRYTNWGSSDILNYKLNDFTLTSVLAYQDLNFYQNWPVEPDPSVPYAPYNAPGINGHTLSEELRLASPSSDRIRYVVGTYFYRLSEIATQEQAGDFTFTALPPNTYESTMDGIAFYQENAFSEAAFANVNVSIADPFEVVLGGRFTHDDNKQSLAYSHGADVSYSIIDFAKTPPTPSGEVSDSKFTYKVSPTYHINNSTLAYATYSTGYKAPGIAFVGGIYSPYRAETVANIEVGIKSEFFDHSLRVNLDAYHELFSDFQAQVRELVAGVPSFVINNAGGLRSEGVESEVDWKATRSLLFSTGVTYQDASFQNYQYGALQLAGKPPTFAPKWSATAGVSYDQPLPKEYSLKADLNAVYKTKYYQVINDPTSIQSAYAIVNGQLGVGPVDGWQAGVYVRNLFDQSYSVGANTFSFGTTRYFTDDARRTVGLFVRAHF